MGAICARTPSVLGIYHSALRLGASGDVLMYADRSIDKEGNERDALGAFSGD
jgi:hypothetical protein